jgi:S-adenosylmethionine:tRNA ribosyltransferase-isomerase
MLTDFMLADFTLADFTLPAELEAHDPPEARGLARDGVRMLVSRRSSGEISHHGFRDLPGLLLPGDLLVVNTSATLPAQVRVSGSIDGLAVHFSSPRPDGGWLVELRQVKDKISMPNGHGSPGQLISLPGGAVLTLESKATARLWHARLSVAVVPYLLRHGIPIRYSYVRRDWPLPCYQTVFAREPGSAEMPSASRPFTPSVVTQLVTRGVLIAPLTLHAGVSSLEADEDPYPEPYDVPVVTARLVNHVRAQGGRIIAAGTTVVRALETAALETAALETAALETAALETAALGTATPTGSRVGPVAASAGWTSHVVTPETGVRAVDGLLTGLHEPRSSHLRMLAAFAGPALLSQCYETAIGSGYLWHEFGDVHLLLP